MGAEFKKKLIKCSSKRQIVGKKITHKKRHANISERAIKTAKKVRAAPDFFLKLFKMVSWSPQATKIRIVLHTCTNFLLLNIINVGLIHPPMSRNKI